jgi:hypothetical protein
MRKDIDGAVILECTGQKGGRYWSGVIRPLAPFAVHEVCLRRGLPSTVINYVDFWDPQILADSISSWCAKQGVTQPVLLCSTLFNAHLLHSTSTLAKTVKILKTQFQLTLIVGGPIIAYEYELDGLQPDLVFSGRALHLFEQWLDDLPISINSVSVMNNTEVYRPHNSDIVEQPIVSELYDDYCLTANDILNFETRLGCKFNCTFCSYEFRNAKKVKDTEQQRLYTFLQQAKDRYGITHFSCVDDTFNEDDEKIENLLGAVRQLDYQPTIVGYQRFDVMMAKTEQIAKLDECGFHGHFFGIETLHEQASKVIRKGARKQKAFEVMQHIRDNYPHWHTCSAYIIGLPHEPLSHITEVMQHIAHNKLLSSVQPSPLSLELRPGNELNDALFSKNPESYGITPGKVEHNRYMWSHELCDHATARVFADRMAATNLKNGLERIDPWEWITGKSLGGRENVVVDNHINNYIQLKQQQLIAV